MRRDIRSSRSRYNFSFGPTIPEPPKQNERSYAIKVYKTGWFRKVAKSFECTHPTKQSALKGERLSKQEADCEKIDTFQDGKWRQSIFE